MSGEDSLKRTRDTSEGLKLATTVFDFIEVDLYNNADKHTVINQQYWIKNSKGEFEEYEMYYKFDDELILVRTWRELERFVNDKILYINDKR